MKRCSVCRVSYPYERFARKSSVRDGRASACRGCDSARRIQRKIEAGIRRPDPPPGYKWCSRCDTEKSLREFYIRRTGRHQGKPHSHCIVCFKADNLARSRARGVQPKRDADPFYVRRKLLARYSLTIEDYDRLLDGQGRACPGCGISADDSRRKFAVDHDHSCCPYDGSCGKCVRGLLCTRCNFAVGHVVDNPETLRRLATYLEPSASSSLSGS